MSTEQVVRLRMGAGHRDREVALPLPPGWQAALCLPRGAPPQGPKGIRRAFAHPVGAPPIRQSARGARSAAILVDDFRRPTPAETLCLAVMEELDAAGVPGREISIIVGGGAHRAMTEPEVRRRLGAAVARAGRVVSHDAFSPEVTFLG
ncbi:MAG: DUF2088 domain-containing protein, partial [Lentisphaeria bacterium]|nr:DUF2088 domain-containing protein [Lentisphaeria bacterium]